MERSPVLRVGREAATLVWMVVALGVMFVAEKQVLTGMGMAFFVERTSIEDDTEFFAGEAMVKAAYGYFVLIAGIALLLVPRRWWVWLGFAAPALVFWVFSTFVSTDGSALISSLALAIAVIVDLVEIPYSIARLVRVIRANRVIPTAAE
jgi:hypothetical protein